MEFNSYEYQRIDIDKFKKVFSGLLDNFEKAESFDDIAKSIKQIYKQRNHFESMSVIASIRHSTDTSNSYYDAENDYYDEVSPVYQGLIHEYYHKLLKSPFREEIAGKWGEMLIKIAELSIKIFSDDIINDLAEENKLVSSYSKLLASAKIEYDGKINNLSQMAPYLQSTERKTRKEASGKIAEFFIENENKFDEIYDRLVEIRNRIALKLGYENFVQLGYDRLGRVGYGPKDTEIFREVIYKNIVPVYENLRERQKERLKLKELLYYDEPLEFLSGNAIPVKDKNGLLEAASKMYREISPQAGEFFEYMLKNGLMDLDHRMGKQAGGYCTFISEYKAPFIFANFNGTSHDVDVLTHEAGHAMQTYFCRDFEISEYIWPTLEAAEIYSMSMEFIAWPWMNEFFGKDEIKYKFAHLSSSIMFLPYSAIVDEFQHFVYTNPHVTPDERKKMWRDTEKKYLPSRDYEDNEFYERGGYWFRQGHIFTNPFYYIDYALAQICSFQFCFNFIDNPNQTWESFIDMCKLGGSRSFLELVAKGKLDNPFEDRTLKDLTKKINDYLNGINDKEM